MKSTLRFAVLIFALSHLPAAQAQTQYFWGNFVGFPSTTAGSTDGAGVAARFDHPLAMTLDGAGNLFVADKLNATIRKVTPDGMVSTFAGKAGVTGTTDSSTGANSRFNQLSGIALDASGNFYVADYGNHTIRYVTSAGSVTTPYGTATTHGHADGVGNAATFNFPTCVVVDKSGNVWVADYSNCTIRKIVPSTGQVTTPYGIALSAGTTDGQGTAARFIHPVSLAFDPSGNLYVSDVGADTIRKITPGGFVSTFAGTANQTGTNDGTGTAARFSDNLGGVATDSNGNVYVADGTNETIRKITPGGVVTTIGGTVSTIGVENGGGTSAQFNLPGSFVVVGNGSTIYMSDYLNNRIVKASTTPNWHSSVVTKSANAAAGARTGAAHPSSNLYFYKGNDNNIWAAFLAGNQWGQQQLTNAVANVSDWLAYEPNYSILCYQSIDGNLWCVFYNTATAQWTQQKLGSPPQGVTVAGDIVVDSSGGWNNVYYRGSDSHMYAAYFNGSAWVHVSLGGTANVSGNLAVEGNNHLIHYKGTDNNIWCFYYTGKVWQQLQLSSNNNVGGSVAVDHVGLLVYYKSNADGSAWCTYSTGGPWNPVQLDATATMNASATTGNIAPYTVNDCTLYLDNNGQADSLYFDGSKWVHAILGDGAWNLTGGLSLQPVSHWAFARRSDGNVIIFFID